MAQGAVTEKLELVDEDGDPVSTEEADGGLVLEVEDAPLRRLLAMIWLELRKANNNGS